MLGEQDRGPGTPRPDQNHPAFDYYRRLHAVREYLHTHLDEEMTLTTAARVAGVSVKYFSAFFRHHTGVRFRDWVSAVRIDRARELLTASNESVTRVGLRVGFRDVRTFQRAFKKHTGVTPSQFKKTVEPPRYD